MNIKKTKAAKTLSKGKKADETVTITTTSVAFKTPTLDGLKACHLHQNEERSVSWIVNKLCDKFLSGETVID